MDALAIVRLIIRVNRKPSRNDAMPGSKDAKEANAHNVLEGGSASGAQAEEAQVDPSFENEYDQGPAADQSVSKGATMSSQTCVIVRLSSSSGSRLSVDVRSCLEAQLADPESALRKGKVGFG